MKHLQNLFVGIGGTFATVALSPQEWAALFAGCATGVWMLTQTVTHILDRVRRK